MGIQIGSTNSSSSSINSAMNVDATSSINESRLGRLTPENAPAAAALGVESESIPDSSKSLHVVGQKRKEPTNKSPLWEHFSRCKLPNSNDLDPQWCTCNYCGDRVLCAKKNGTSSMWAHTRRCLIHPLHPDTSGDPKQTKLKSDYVNGAATYHKYNRKRCDEKCIYMIIRDELAFRFVEKDGFKDFCHEMEPQWSILHRKQVAKGVLDKFNFENAVLLSQLKSSETRISITTDCWTSIHNINYLVLTAHFMDNDWKLHKRTINFCAINSHKGDDIGRVIEQCLRQWEITKVFIITVDNASANDVAVAYMKRRLRGYKTLLFDGEYLHLRCACHIINLIVKDGLKELEDGIASIWNCAKYVRSSSQRLDKFREFAVLEQCKTNANIPLDVITRWNSTYIMLEAALKYEQVFARMVEEDGPFKAYFEEKDKNGKSKVGPPKLDDWRNA